MCIAVVNGAPRSLVGMRANRNAPLPLMPTFCVTLGFFAGFSLRSPSIPSRPALGNESTRPLLHFEGLDCFACSFSDLEGLQGQFIELENRIVKSNLRDGLYSCIPLAYITFGVLVQTPMSGIQQ